MPALYNLICIDPKYMVGTSNKIEVPVVRPRIDPDPDREVKVPW